MSARTERPRNRFSRRDILEPSSTLRSDHRAICWLPHREKAVKTSWAGSQPRTDEGQPCSTVPSPPEAGRGKGLPSFQDPLPRSLMPTGLIHMLPGEVLYLLAYIEAGRPRLRRSSRIAPAHSATVCNGPALLRFREVSLVGNPDIGNVLRSITLRCALSPASLFVLSARAPPDLQPQESLLPRATSLHRLRAREPLRTPARFPPTSPHDHAPGACKCLATETGDHTARLWRNPDNIVIGLPTPGRIGCAGLDQAR